MAARVAPVSVLRVPARVDLWGWATRSVTLSFPKDSVISTPYAETSPVVAAQEHPIPKVQLDPAIFEVSEEDEYRSVKSFMRSLTTTTPVANESNGPSSSQLLTLVLQCEYAGANRLRVEMIQNHLPITPDHRFIHAAIFVARSSESPGLQLEMFNGWLSLLPAADEVTKGQQMFDHLMRTLSQNPHPDVRLIMAFVRICVSKGYVAIVPDHMIPLVVRFAPPSDSLQFLEDLLEDLRSSVTENLTLDVRAKRKIRFWCKTATKQYLAMDLVKEAVKVFQMCLQYGLTLPHTPSRWLWKAVAKDPDHFGLSEEAIAVLKLPKMRLPYCKKPSPRPDLRLDIPSDLIPQSLDAGPSDPRALLSKVVENAHSAKAPDPYDIARFLEICDSQPTAIQRISAYNRLKPIPNRGNWILGEMLYYARRKEWRELIGAFDTYFFRVGVPVNIDGYKSRGRVTPPTVVQRLFPLPSHTSLVWKAAVEILQEARPVSILFKQLVEQATMPKTIKYARGGPALLHVPIGTLTARHFSPFLATAYRGQRYKHLVEVFSEMSRLGIKPRAEQLALLAGAYAGMADGYEAFRTLDRMEDICKKEELTNRSRLPFHGLSNGAALYIPALRGFMGRGNLRGASLVRQRILKCGYAKGTNSDLDLMLEKLEMPTKGGK